MSRQAHQVRHSYYMVYYEESILKALHLQGKKQLLLYVTFAISELSAWGGYFPAPSSAQRLAAILARGPSDDLGRRPRATTKATSKATTSGDDLGRRPPGDDHQATNPGDDPRRRPWATTPRRRPSHPRATTSRRRPPGDDPQARTPSGLHAPAALWPSAPINLRNRAFRCRRL